MIVENYSERKAEAAKEILKNPTWTNRAVLDLSPFNDEDRKLFLLAVEMLGTLKILHVINEFLQVRGSNQTVKTEILQKAIAYIIEKKTFTDNDLEEWFLFLQEFEGIVDDVIKLHNMDIYYFSSSDIDLLLMDVPLGAIEKIRGNDKFDGFGDTYIELRGEFIEKKKAYIEFLTAARELINEAVKGAEKE